MQRNLSPTKTFKSVLRKIQNLNGLADCVQELNELAENEIERMVEVYKTDSLHLADRLAKYFLANAKPDECRAKGVVYTPYWLALRLTRNAQKIWNQLHRSGRQPSTIADMSSGIGVFLLAAEQTFGKGPRYLGQEIDPVAVEYAKLIRFAFDSNWDLLCNDTLLNSPHKRNLFNSTAVIDEKPDLLIGNPPYVRSQLLNPNYVNNLKETYESLATGNFDLSIAFLEHAIENLNDGGLASYIVSNKFMTAKYGQLIRHRLSLKTRIINIEDFRDLQLFEGYTTYTCIITFAKLPSAKRFSITRFPTTAKKFSDPGIGERVTVPSENLGSGTWDFAVGSINDILANLRDSKNPTIAEVIGPIYQGIRTGANSIFVTKPELAAKNERSVLRPFVSGEQIKRFYCRTDELSLIYPYVEDVFGVRLLSPLEMQQNYPECWAYLLKHREQLEERALDTKNHWYAYSRSQNLNICTIRKIFVKEMMPRAEFAADEVGNVLCCSGYVLDATRLNSDQLRLWVSVLNTPTMEFILRHNSTQLHSGWFRVLKHYLVKTRLPDLRSNIKVAQELANRLFRNPADIEALTKLDEIVASSFGLCCKHLKLINDYLKDCHARSCPKYLNANYDFASPTNDSNERSEFEPVKLDQFDKFHRERFDLQKLVTFVPNKRIGIHNWYPYTQGFSDQLVKSLIEELHLTSPTVLDPFGGCGTTALTCRRLGLHSISIDISPFVSWVSQVKTTVWNAGALETTLKMLDFKKARFAKKPEKYVFDDFLSKAYSPYILSQIQGLIKFFRSALVRRKEQDFFLLGLISIMEQVSQIRKHGSHYRFMLDSENIGLQKLTTKIIAPDTNIIPFLLEKLKSMIADVKMYEFKKPLSQCKIITASAVKMPIKNDSIDAIITSPPYLNRNNYIAQHKAELALLGLVKDYSEFRNLVRSTLRSHVESSLDGTPVTSFSEVRTILEKLENINQNNPKIPHMIAGYFEDLNVVIKECYRVLKPKGEAAFVVGNTRWCGIVVPVDHLVANICEMHGLRLRKILVTRYKGNSPQQMAKYGRIPVRESIVIVRKEH